jgi:hypothetical protein
MRIGRIKICIFKPLSGCWHLGIGIVTRRHLIKDTLFFIDIRLIFVELYIHLLAKKEGA